MVIAALVTFAILLGCWIVAPSSPRRTPAAVIPDAVEPIAA